MAQIVGGAVLLGGLYFTAQTLRTTQEGQITDRFTKAIEQLGKTGDQHLAIRLGGIYALERIAKDSEKDHLTVMKVLAAFVRASAPRQEHPQEECSDTGERWVCPIPEEQRPTWTPRVDIQAVLTVLGQHTRPYDSNDPKKGEIDRLNLDGTDLRGIDIREVLGLRLARLYGADLRGATLTGADLRNTVFYKADLRYAILWKANFQRDPSAPQRERWGASLQGADLRGANLVEAQLQGASLKDACLRGANLTDAQLQGARFSAAQLQGACLKGANFEGAKLPGANLEGVKDLAPNQLKHACGDDDTKLPKVPPGLIKPPSCPPAAPPQ